MYSLTHSQINNPLTDHQVTSECFCAVGPLLKVHSNLLMCSCFEDLSTKIYTVLCITHLSEVQNSGHTACLAKTLQPQLQEKHTCPPKVVFMHCVSSRQALPRSQDSLENVSLSGRSRHDDYCAGEGGTFKALLSFPTD